MAVTLYGLETAVRGGIGGGPGTVEFSIPYPTRVPATGVALAGGGQAAAGSTWGLGWATGAIATEPLVVTTQVVGSLRIAVVIANSITGQPGGGGEWVDPFEELYDSFEDAIGEPAINGITDVEVLPADNPGAIAQGFTEKWIGKSVSDGQWYSAFRNPQTGKFTGGHLSSR
jgi:hypothetical protein